MASIVTSFSVVRRLPGLPAGREDFGAHITVDIGPFVVLLGQDDTDKEDDRVTAGKDADDVGAPVDFLNQALLRIVAPRLAPDLAGKSGERQNALAGLVGWVAPPGT